MSTNAETIREHMDTLALGGGHPLMVVVPRAAIEAVLTENDELREYQEQEEALRACKHARIWKAVEAIQ